MRSRRLISALLVVLAGSLFVTASVASAGPKEDIAAATMKWAKTLEQHDPDKVVLLYATDGVLWGTLSPTLRADRAALRDYFVTAFKVLPNLNGHVRRAIDPRLWQNRCQHRLLYVLVYQGRRNQDATSAL